MVFKAPGHKAGHDNLDKEVLVGAREAFHVVGQVDEQVGMHFIHLFHYVLLLEGFRPFGHILHEIQL